MKTMLVLGLAALMLTAGLALMPSAAADCYKVDAGKFGAGTATVCAGTQGECGVFLNGGPVRGGTTHCEWRGLP